MIFEEIREVICEQLEVEPEKISLETTFEDLGADSLDLFQIIVELEDKYGIQLEDAESIKTVEEAVSYVKNALAEKDKQ
ncbi:acyl carrier protein [Clostridium sp. MSJ-8]|uniref:acyl carrier protein n=1 Tax=Clostridium sp. MSJ-8 TaxID=2841510 RepID=UPI001C0F21A6|nr:acyl carrier protein [Clostridium sp. MSJ-8]MBU5487767.1 acyl carrier protein [Clostridium sp. MSJ-8]